MMRHGPDLEPCPLYAGKFLRAAGALVPWLCPLCCGPLSSTKKYICFTLFLFHIHSLNSIFPVVSALAHPGVTFTPVSFASSLAVARSGGPTSHRETSEGHQVLLEQPARPRCCVGLKLAQHQLLGSPQAANVIVIAELGISGQGLGNVLRKQ